MTVDPPESFTATTIALGGYHSCTRRQEDNDLYCWGQNTYGQLGVGGGNRNRPIKVTLNP